MNETGSHLTDTEIGALLAQRANRQEILPQLRHLDRCAECRQKAAALLPPPAFVLATVNGTSHLDAETIRAYVHRALDPAEREIADAHLDQCAFCREDVAAAPRDFPGARTWIAAAAAAVIIAVGLTALLRPRHAAPVPPAIAAPSSAQYSNPEWTALVAEVRKSRTLPRRNDLDDLRPPADTLRGNSESSAASVRPAGVVVDSTRPRFQWTAFKKATYVVVVQAIDSSRIQRSPRLTTNEWMPDFALGRGTTYEWQVEVNQRGAPITIPAPPAPPALIRILESPLHDEIARAHAIDPNDHLLLAVLEARAGLDADARSELALLRSDPQTRELADDLLHSLPSGR